MAPTTNGGIQHDASRSRPEDLQNLIAHHRHVLEVRSPKSIRRWISSLSSVIDLLCHDPVHTRPTASSFGTQGSSLDRPPTGDRLSGCLPESG